MSDDVKASMWTAVLRMLEPLMLMLDEAGVSAPEFHSLARQAHVRALAEAARLVGTPERGLISKIGVRTGLSRKAVREILNADQGPPALATQRAQRAERVLGAWWTEPEFQDDQGRPALLRLRGRSPSFTELVQRFSGEALVGTILAELKRVNAVRVCKDGRLQAISKNYATTGWEPDAIAASAEQVRELLQTILHNLRDPTQKLYVRRVVNLRLDKAWAGMLRRDFTREGDSTFDGFENALNDPQRTVKASDHHAEARTLGATMYVFERPAPHEPPRTRRSKPARAKQTRVRAR